jgi:iron complex transport system substrate-binding protein
LSGIRIKQIWLILLLLLVVTGNSWCGSLALTGDAGIVDSAGRRISVDVPFRRVISLYAAHTENVYSLGAEDQLVGVSRSSRYPAAAIEKPRFSQRDGAEKFLAARPDLVLIRPMIDRAYPGLIQQLEKYGVTVVSLQPGTTAEMYRYWMVLGRLLGREPQAVEMVSTFSRQMKTITDITASLSPKKRVYFEAIHQKMKTFTPGAMAVFCLTTAGGINVAADAISVRGTNIAFYGKERILAKGTQIDVYLAQRGRMNPVTVEQIHAEPGFDTIRAVREGQVYLIDEAIVSRPTRRLITGVCRIGKILYPDLFPATFTGICH